MGAEFVVERRAEARRRPVPARAIVAGDSVLVAGSWKRWVLARVLLQLENLALLDREGVEWCDSCAAPDHPMIDGLWSGRRPIGRVSVALGGTARRGLFERLVDAELARTPLASA